MVDGVLILPVKNKYKMATTRVQTIAGNQNVSSPVTLTSMSNEASPLEFLALMVKIPESERLEEGMTSWDIPSVLMTLIQGEIGSSSFSQEMLGGGSA